MERRSAYWRDQAEEYRKRAEQTHVVGMRLYLLKMEQACLKIAEQLEASEAGNDKPRPSPQDPESGQ